MKKVGWINCLLRTTPYPDEITLTQGPGVISYFGGAPLWLYFRPDQTCPCSSLSSAEKITGEITYRFSDNSALVWSFRLGYTRLGFSTQTSPHFEKKKKTNIPLTHVLNSSWVRKQKWKLLFGHIFAETLVRLILFGSLQWLFWKHPECARKELLSKCKVFFISVQAKFIRPPNDPYWLIQSE